MQANKLRAHILAYIFLILVAGFVAIPILGIIRLAVDGSIKGAPTEFRLLPEEPTLAVFQKVFKQPSQTLSYPGLLKNSLIVSLGAAFLAIAFGTSMAYAFARMRFPGKQAGLFGLLLGTLLPLVALMTPLYIILSRFGIRSSLFGLIVVYTAFAMPFCVWNMRSAFQAVPKELEEAAFIDGANEFTTFRQITLPISAPAIAVAALVAFLAGYTEFAVAWLFVENSQNVTVAMAVWGMFGYATWPEIAALAILMSLPVVLIFLILHRYLIDRLLIGSV